jgi:hypothetical protein
MRPELTEQMQYARWVWQRDKQNQTPAMLSHRFNTK